LKCVLFLPGARKSIFQRQAKRWRRCGRPLLRIFVVAVFAGAGVSCPAAIPAEHNERAPATSPTLRLTLEDALARARKNSTQFQAGLSDAALARGDKSLARDALLPNVNYNTQYLYTQGNGPGEPVRYIANNAVHEIHQPG